MVCQLEINRQTTLSALKIAKDNGVVTIFNPAPAPEQGPLSSDFYKYSDVICPNETEVGFSFETVCNQIVFLDHLNLL